MHSLAGAPLSSLATTETSLDTKLALTGMSVGLTIEKASAERKLFQVSREHSPDTVLKTIVVLLRSFVDSIKVAAKPDAADIIEIADELAGKYTHDSLADLLLALKEARSTMVFYNKLECGDIYRAIGSYFERKSAWFENDNLNQKARSTSAEHNTVALLSQGAPQLTQHMALRMDPSHPNAESHRRRLSIINNREQRGLIPSEKADKLRADVAAVLVRKPRADWGRR